MLASASCWPSGSSTWERRGTTRCGCALRGRRGRQRTLAPGTETEVMSVRSDHPSFSGPGRKRKLLRGGAELPKECQVTFPLSSQFQPRPPEQVKRGSASARGPRGVVRSPGVPAGSFPLPCVSADPRHGQHEQRARRTGAAGRPQDAAEGQLGGRQGWGQAQDPDGQPRRRRHLPLRGNQGAGSRGIGAHLTQGEGPFAVVPATFPASYPKGAGPVTALFAVREPVPNYRWESHPGLR